METAAEFGFELFQPGGVDQSDPDEVTEVNAVFITKGHEFHSHQRIQAHNAKLIGGFGLCHIRRSGWTIRMNLLRRENQMNSVFGAGVWSIKKQVQSALTAQAGKAAVNESGGFQCAARGREVAASKENIDIARVTNGSFVHTRNPRGNSVSASDGVRNVCSLERLCRAKHPITHFFHTANHTRP